MKIDLKDFRVSPKKQIRIAKLDTEIKPFYDSKEHYKELLASDVDELSDLQRVLYASDRYSVLLIFQAMDTAGKDGAIRHVLSGINPQSCDVSSFKQPSAEELQHDFLWRTNSRMPGRGRIGVFNRSYYEEVLVVRVHPENLAREGLAEKMPVDSSFWKGRYHSIVDMEKHLHRNDTIILKFFLNISKDEQQKRLLERIDQPDKNWKFSAADIVERTFWDDYMDAYEECLSATSTKTAPWFAIPADDKYNARLIISRIIIETLQKLDMKYPEVSETRSRELQKIRSQLLHMDKK